MVWVSVKDRLPKPEMAVLTYYKGGIWMENGIRVDAIDAETGKFICVERMGQEVTHWMEFPEPPKQD